MGITWHRSLRKKYINASIILKISEVQIWILLESHYGISIAYSRLGMHTQSLRELTRSQLAGVPSNNPKDWFSAIGWSTELYATKSQSISTRYAIGNTLSSSYKNLVEILAIIIKTNAVNPLVFRLIEFLELLPWSARQKIDFKRNRATSTWPENFNRKKCRKIVSFGDSGFTYLLIMNQSKL